MTTAKAPRSFTTPRLSCFSVCGLSQTSFGCSNLTADDGERSRRVDDSRFLRGGDRLPGRARNDCAGENGEQSCEALHDVSYTEDCRRFPMAKAIETLSSGIKDRALRPGCPR